MNFQIWDELFHVSRDLWRKIMTLRVSLTIKNLNWVESVIRLSKKSWRKQADGTKTKLLWQSLTGNSMYFTKLICLKFLSPNLFLNDTVWLNNTFHFGMRCCQEHRELYWRDVKLCKEAQGNEHIVNNERQTKTNYGVDASNFRRVFPKMFSIGDERDLVIAYKIYREKRLENMMADDAPFYLGIPDGSKEHWFNSAPMGVNKLNTPMETRASKGSINNERLTNHNARKDMIQKRNFSEIPPAYVMQLSGQKNA